MGLQKGIDKLALFSYPHLNIYMGGVKSIKPLKTQHLHRISINIDPYYKTDMPNYQGVLIEGN